MDQHIKNAGELIAREVFNRFSNTIYEIPSKPVPLKRARHGKRRTWDEQSQLKHGLRLLLSSQHGSFPLWDVPLVMHATFYMPIPKVKTGKLVGRPHYYKPDLSNLIKFVEDVGTGIIYRDDSLICCCNAQKIYDENPRTEFYFTLGE